MSLNDTNSTDMVIPEDASSSVSVPSKSFPWANLAKVFAAIGAIGGLILPLMGYVSHQSYLTAWGIDPGLFPQTANDMVVTGFFALTDRLANIVTIFNNNFGTITVVGIAVAIYAFLVLLVGKSIDRDKATKLRKKLPPWCTDLAGALAMTSFGLVGVPIALAFATIILVVPILLADSFGHSWAERQQNALTTACDSKSVAGKCIELLKDKTVIAEGFTIESSLSHIALFDVAEKRVRAIERAGTELRSRISH